MHLRKSWFPSSILSTQRINNALKGLARDVVVSAREFSDTCSDFTDDCIQGANAIYQFSKDRVSRIPHNVSYFIHNPIGFGKSTVVSTLAVAMMPVVGGAEIIQAFNSKFKINDSSIELNYFYRLSHGGDVVNEYRFKAGKIQTITLLDTLPFPQSNYSLSTILCPTNLIVSSVNVFSYIGNRIGVEDEAFRQFLVTVQGICKSEEIFAVTGTGVFALMICCILSCCCVIRDRREAKPSAAAQPLLSDPPFDAPVQEPLDDKPVNEVKIALGEAAQSNLFRKRSRLEENLSDDRPTKRARQMKSLQQ